MATIYGFSLKGIKTFKGREGEGCQGDIYYDGKKVGWYSDNADGGMADIDFYGEIEQRKRMSDLLKAATVKYYAQYPLTGEFASLEPNEEMFMSELVGFTEHEKEFKKYQKDGYIAMAVFRKPGDDLYEYTQLFKRKAAIEEFQKRTDIEQARIYTKDAFVITDEQPLITQGEGEETTPNMGM